MAARGYEICLSVLIVRVQWPGFDSGTWRHMWVEFVGSLLCTERFFSTYSGFPSPQKPTFDLICGHC